MQYTDYQLEQIRLYELDKYIIFLHEKAKNVVVVPGKGFLQSCKNKKLLGIEKKGKRIYTEEQKRRKREYKKIHRDQILKSRRDYYQTHKE